MGIIRFFNKIERCLLRFRIGALVEDWRKGGKRVVIYGAGFHTKNLLDVMSLRETKIVGVSDSDPNKHGTDCRGYYVIKPEEILKAKPDVILMSSKDHEGEIYNQLRFMEGEGVG